MASRDDPYDVSLVAPASISPAELAQLVAILDAGGAVDPISARQQIPLCLHLAVARHAGHVVGLGAIKQPRRGYTTGIQQQSGVRFDPATPEMGYVAVDGRHRGYGLAHRIVRTLLAYVSSRSLPQPIHQP